MVYLKCVSPPCFERHYRAQAAHVHCFSKISFCSEIIQHTREVIQITQKKLIIAQRANTKTTRVYVVHEQKLRHD